MRRLLGGALGLAAAWGFRGFLMGMIGNLPGANVQVRMHLDPRVLLFTLALAVAHNTHSNSLLNTHTIHINTQNTTVHPSQSKTMR